MLKLDREETVDAIIEWNVMRSALEDNGFVGAPLIGPYGGKGEFLIGLLTTSENSAPSDILCNCLITKGKVVVHKYGNDINVL